MERSLMRAQRARVHGGVLGALGFILGCFIVAGLGAAPQTLPKGKLERPVPLVKGLDLFKNYCAVCHGSDAKGNGPLAPFLKAKPADLTVLGKTNGGKFPSERVRSTIAGDDEVPSHGSRAMPVWGPIFRQIQSDQVPANVRLDNLVKYLESIQQK
jgi:mono/diheme cytochrome c family protein